MLQIRGTGILMSGIPGTDVYTIWIHDICTHDIRGIDTLDMMHRVCVRYEYIYMVVVYMTGIRDICIRNEYMAFGYGRDTAYR